MSFAAVQKHVAVLERAGLVTKERTGRRKVVRTNIEGLRLARGLLDQYEALWRGRVDRMTELIARMEDTRTHDRYRRPQGPGHPDPDPDRRVRGAARARLGAVGRSAPARALVGPAHLPRDLHRPRPRARQPRRVPHDRARAATSRTASGTSSRPIRRAGSSSSTASPTRTARRTTTFPRNEGRVTIEPIDAGRTRMSIESTFPSTEAMEQVLAMGMEEGLNAGRRPDRRHPRREHDDDRSRHDDDDDRADDAHPGRARRDLTYDVREVDAGAEPALLLIGSPMGASGFATLASALPRSHRHHLRPARRRAQHQGRSGQPSPRPTSTPTTSIASSTRSALGPVDLFASSGGAVNALALVARHPEQVRTLVAHEPPLASILPDREGAMAVDPGRSTTPTSAAAWGPHGAVHPAP